MPTKPLYRAEHVGSLLRPLQLLEARDAYAQGSVSETEPRPRRPRHFRRSAPAARHRPGIFTGGEMRRGSWLTDMAEAVEGFVRDRVMLDWKGPNGGPEASTANAVGGKLRKTRMLAAHELPLLQAAVPGALKITLAAPSNFVVSSYKAGLTERFYPTHAALLSDLENVVEASWFALVDALRLEVMRLHEQDSNIDRAVEDYCWGVSLEVLSTASLQARLGERHIRSRRHSEPRR